MFQSLQHSTDTVDVNTLRLLATSAPYLFGEGSNLALEHHVIGHYVTSALPSRHLLSTYCTIVAMRYQNVAYRDACMQFCQHFWLPVNRLFRSCVLAISTSLLSLPIFQSKATLRTVLRSHSC